MAKFLSGIVLGALLALGYVHYDWELPDALQLPARLQGNLISSATESELYDLDGDAATRQRALEVYFANRAEDAAKLDAQAGHPFLDALMRTRAQREARQLLMNPSGAEMALSKPALRAALERKYATTDVEVLKRAMLMEALQERTFLKAWLEKTDGVVTADNLAEKLARAARDPTLPD